MVNPLRYELSEEVTKTKGKGDVVRSIIEDLQVDSDGQPKDPALAIEKLALIADGFDVFDNVIDEEQNNLDNMKNEILKQARSISRLYDRGEARIKQEEAEKIQLTDVDKLLNGEKI